MAKQRTTKATEVADSNNYSSKVIDDFGVEWQKYQFVEGQATASLDNQFSAYFSSIDMKVFNPKSSIAADFGAGSGRWSERICKFFSLLYVLEPSDGAIGVLQEKFSNNPKVKLIQEKIGSDSIPHNSLDLAFSLGVLHHLPDTKLAISDICKRIKPGGTFVCYLYYNLENKKALYRFIFQIANLMRLCISRMPVKMKIFATKLIALFIYFPLARLSKLLSSLKINNSNIPLHHYANMPFLVMANDSLDRFGTTLEKRFSKQGIIEMLSQTDFDISTLKFSDMEPFWTFSVNKTY